jgi:hypothetical protein
MMKETYSTKEPLFLRFINKELQASDLLGIFSRSADPFTSETATKALSKEPFPNLEAFREEMKDAVRDLIKDGPSEEFKAFVNHYMEPSLTEDVQRRPSQWGENVSRQARVKDPESTWLEGLICYNLSLYIKIYGLEDLKVCRVCSKFFAHKGKWAVYCSDACKASGKLKKI